MRSTATLATLLLTALSLSSARAATFAELLLHVPEEANTLVMLNMDKIFGSELAQADDWRKRHTNLFEF